MMYILYGTFAADGGFGHHCLPERHYPLARFSSFEKAQAYVESAKNDPPEFTDINGLNLYRCYPYRRESLLAPYDSYKIEGVGNLIDPEPMHRDYVEVLYFTYEPHEPVDNRDIGRIYAVLSTGEREMVSTYQLQCQMKVNALNTLYGLKEKKEK